MRLLIIDDTIKEVIQRVVTYAEMHVYSMDDLLDMYNKQLPIVGDIPEHVCHIPMGFRVVYSIEEQNVGKIRHISISVETSGKLPSVPAIEQIIKLFGYTNDLCDCLVRLEPIGDNHEAITVVEKM